MKKIIALALALVLMLAISVPVFAEDSPENPGEKFNVTVNGSHASYTKNEDGTITFTTDDESAFKGWVIEGKYEIVSGSLDSPTLVVRPLSDLKATLNGEKVPSGDDKSPATGNNPAVFAILALCSLAGAAYATKRAVTNA